MKTHRLRYSLLSVLLIILLIISILIWRSFDSNVRFQQLKKDYNKNYNVIITKDTVLMGIPAAAQLSALISHFNHYKFELQKIKPEQLKAPNRAAWQQMSQVIVAQIQFLQKLRQDPRLYNIGELYKSTLKNKERTLKSRLQLIENQLQIAAKYYDNAKANLINPDSANLQPAIQQQLQTLHFLQNELLDSLYRAKLSQATHETFLANTHKAKLAVKDYLAFCRSLQFEFQNTNNLKQK